MFSLILTFWHDVLCGALANGDILNETVIPGEMREARAASVGAAAATVEWKVPFNLQLFPPGLQFRVAYRVLASWADPAEYHVSAASPR